MTDRSRPDFVYIAVTGALPLAVGFGTNLATSTNNVLVWLAPVVLSAMGMGAQWLFARTSDTAGPRRHIVAVSMVALSVLIVIGAAVATAGTRGLGPPRVIHQVDSYALKSSEDLCPTEDKIDLDSARPGHGGQEQIGEYDALPEAIQELCRHEGGLAELILEDDELHGPDGDPVFVRFDGGDAGYEQCRTALDEVRKATSKLALSGLAAGDRICVRTDIGNIALVTIEKINVSRSAARATIKFIVWSPPAKR